MSAHVPECPGRATERNPVLEQRRCPCCGQMIEIWSHEEKIMCSCGETVFGEKIPSCAQWCKEAEKCFGAKLQT